MKAKKKKIVSIISILVCIITLVMPVFASNKRSDTFIYRLQVDKLVPGETYELKRFSKRGGDIFGDKCYFHNDISFDSADKMCTIRNETAEIRKNIPVNKPYEAIGVELLPIKDCRLDIVETFIDNKYQGDNITIDAYIAATYYITSDSANGIFDMFFGGYASTLSTGSIFMIVACLVIIIAVIAVIFSKKNKKKKNKNKNKKSKNKKSKNKKSKNKKSKNKKSKNKKSKKTI